MAGTYSPPEPTSVDFTVREAQPPQPTGLEIVVNGNEVLKSYSAPDNDSVNLTLQEETVADNDSADFFIEASELTPYGPPKQNNLDFTLARTFATTQDNTDYVVGADFNASLIPYRAPDQNNLDFTLARTIQTTQDDTDYVVGGEFKPQLIPYEPPDQNSLDFVIDKYEADTQDSADYIVAGEFTPEKYEFQAPAYTPEQPDDLTFTLFGYESQQPDELLFELSLSTTPSDGPYTISETNPTISTLSAGQDSNVVAETGPTPNQLSPTQQSTTQQPVSNISNSLDPTQDETVIADVANIVSTGRYIQLLIQSPVGAGLDQLSPEQKEKEQASFPNPISVLSPEQGSHSVVDINSASQSLATQLDTEKDLVAVSQLQSITALDRGDEDQHEKGELFVGDPFIGLRRFPAEYPVGETLSVTDSFITQQSSVVQQEVVVSTTSPEIQVSTTVIVPVSEVIQNLEAAQDTTEIINVANIIQEGLAPLGRKRIQQQRSDISISMLEPDRETLLREQFPLEATVLTNEWEREEFPQGAVTASTTSFDGEQGTHRVVNIDLDPGVIDYVISVREIASVDITADTVEYQTPEIPQSPGFATTNSPEIQNSSNVQADVGNEANNQIYQIPEYEEQAASFSTTSSPIQSDQNVQAEVGITSNSLSVDDVDHIARLAGISATEYLQEADSYVSADGTAQVFVGEESIEGEHGIVVINVPVISNLEYFERDDIGSGGGQEIPFRSAASFSSEFGVFKRGEKNVYLL